MMIHRLTLLAILFAAVLPGSSTGAEKPKPSKQIAHTPRKIEGWTIHVDNKLLGEEKAIGDQILSALGHKLYLVKVVIPPDRLPQLQQVPIFLDLNHELGPMQYHPDSGWLRRKGYDVAMTKAVHIPRARYLIGTDFHRRQPWAVLHELAHAYHDRVLGFNHPGIRAAYDKAKANGSYEKVLHIHGRKSRHYALSDHKEYFAELTESYFGRNDFYPFVRPELKEHDAEAYRVLEEVWGIKR
ncbi:MAG: metallopeptidase [Phycisphaerae bacterium]|nr:metallopeptidase [Phycisphaerae bacterium]